MVLMFFFVITHILYLYHRSFDLAYHTKHHLVSQTTRCRGRLIFLAVPRSPVT